MELSFLQVGSNLICLHDFGLSYIEKKQYFQVDSNPNEIDSNLLWVYIYRLMYRVKP